MAAFQFDPFDFAVHADPYPFYAVLRRDHPAYFSEGANCWVLSRHADVVAAMGKPLVFSSTAGNVISDSPEKVGRTVGSADPPRHTRLRALVDAAFNRRQVTNEAARIGAETRRLMDRLPERFDLVAELTAPLAGSVMSTLLGMEEDAGRFKRLLDVTLYRDPVTRERTAEGVAAQAELLALVAAGVERRRRAPGADLISHLLAAEAAMGTQGAAALSPDEVVWMARAVLGAGFESTSSLLANGTLALLTHPAQWRRLADGAVPVEAAVEEMLRFETPAQRFARVLTEDQAMHGQHMRAGTRVMVMYGSANRDEAVFERAAEFDVGRRPGQGMGRHLGFGHGVHFCAGAVLARLVARIFFTELPTRLPGLRLAQDGPLDWAHSPTFRSLVGLRVSRA